MKTRRSVSIRACATALSFCASAALADVIVSSGDELEAALASAPSGETIRLQAGTYPIAAAIIEGKSLTIAGAGADATFIVDEETYSGRSLTFSNAPWIVMMDLSIFGSEGYPGFPPSHCVGGLGGDGAPAAIVENVADFRAIRVNLIGGAGGIGQPNTGSCPAPGTTGTGAAGIEFRSCPKVALHQGRAGGNWGRVLGDSLRAAEGSHVVAHATTIDAGADELGTGEAAVDATSSFRLESTAAISSETWMLF